jgi:integrase
MEHEFARMETAAAVGRQSGSDKGVDALKQALSQAQIPNVLQLALQSHVLQVVDRLRNFLHLGKLTGYYFGNDGCQTVSREYWATELADGAIESSTYWPFGKPSRWYERRLHYALFFKQLELDALFEERPDEKAFPVAKMPDLVAALRSLDHLADREEQREALRKLPEFARYLAFYLDVVRQRLLGGSTCTALWLNSKGGRLSYLTIGRIISGQSEDRLGVRITPHDARDAAATTWAIAAPDQIGIARDLLAHRDLRTTIKYYNRAKGVEASRAYRQVIDGMRRKQNYVRFRHQDH